MPTEHIIHVPTYDTQTFGDPQVPCVIDNLQGLHAVLGSIDPQEPNKPAITAERRKSGWLIMINTFNGGDATVLVLLHDDGRLFITPEGMDWPNNAVIARHDSIKASGETAYRMGCEAIDA